jgi:hypothetical protein
VPTGRGNGEKRGKLARSPDEKKKRIEDREADAGVVKLKQVGCCNVKCYDLDLQTFDVTVKLNVGGYSKSGKADQFPD